MGFLTRFNPAARLKGERDVIAIYFMKHLVPETEMHVIRDNQRLSLSFTSEPLTRAINDRLLREWSILGPHLSQVQAFNLTRNAGVVSIGLSRDIDGIIQGVGNLDDSGVLVDMRKLTRALDLMLFDIGMLALKASVDKAIDLSSDAVTSILEDAFEFISRRRISYGNPYGVKDFWNMRA